MNARPALFLDRDGVLVAERALVTRADQLEILPGVPQALARASALGFSLVIVTNQAVVARGMVSEEKLAEIHAELVARLRSEPGVGPVAVYACPHHPHAQVPRYRGPCNCRKPAPGMLLQAAKEQSLDLSASFLVGDRATDIVAAQRAGVRGLLIDTPDASRPAIVGGENCATEAKAVAIVQDLGAAVAWISRAHRTMEE